MSAIAAPRPSSGLLLLRDAPLALCYLAFPLSNEVAEVLGRLLYRNWIDIAWGVLLAVMVMFGSHRRQIRLMSKTQLLIITGCAAAITLAALGVAAGQAPLVTAAMELKPVLYLLVVIIILSRTAAPDPKAFCRYGMGLAWLLIVEALVRSLAYETIARPFGSGEINYDAALLCISLVFSTTDRRLFRRYGWFIFAGIIASFSRTSLLAAALVILFSNVISLRLRLLMCALAVGATFGAFAVRGMEVGTVENLDRYWMWLVGFDYLSSSPIATALNVMPGRALEVDVPIALEWLWTQQQEGLGVEGIFPFHFHAMWLRLAVSWGWLPVVVAMAAFYRSYVADRFRAPKARSFFTVCVVLGLTMGLLYLSNVAPIALLAGYQLRPRHPVRLRHRRKTSSTQRAMLPAAPPQGSGATSMINAYP